MIIKKNQIKIVEELVEKNKLWGFIPLPHEIDMYFSKEIYKQPFPRLALPGIMFDPTFPGEYKVAEIIRLLLKKYRNRPEVIGKVLRKKK